MSSLLLLKTDLSKLWISAASSFFSVWRLPCFAKHGLQECSNSAVLFFQHCSLQLPRQPQPLCGGLFIPTAPHAPHVLQVICAWNCNSAQLEILSRILLIANCLESASSFPSDHILHFPYTEDWSGEYFSFFGLVLIIFPISDNKKKILLLRLIFFL